MCVVCLPVSFGVLGDVFPSLCSSTRMEMQRLRRSAKQVLIKFRNPCTKNTPSGVPQPTPSNRVATLDAPCRSVGAASLFTSRVYRRVAQRLQREDDAALRERLKAACCGPEASFLRFEFASPCEAFRCDTEGGCRGGRGADSRGTGWVRGGRGWRSRLRGGWVRKGR